MSALPAELREGLGNFFNAFGRAVAPHRDPLGTARARHFVELALIAHRTRDPRVLELMESLIRQQPAAARPTIALEVVTRALDRGDVDTARRWLPRAGSLLRAEMADWRRVVPDDDRGLQLVMEMLRLDPGFEIVAGTLEAFIRPCVKQDACAAIRFLHEGVELIGLAQLPAAST